MAKNIVQDVLPPDRRSIRNIPLPNHREVKETPAKRPKEHRQESWKTPVILWVIAILSVAVLFFAAGSLFIGATVKVTPKQEKISFDENFVLTAQKKGNGQGLQYEVVTLTKEAGKEVSATEDKYTETKASGQIVVYNNYDSESQRLIKNTRFETPSGLIYRIAESVIVPAKTPAGPGSIEVTIFADEPGEKYNIGLTDFTVPGFAGTPRFEGFYARSKTPMTEGFVGNQKQVGNATLTQTREEIKTTLRADLLKEAQSQIPANFVLYPGALFISFEDLQQTNVKTTSVEIRERGVAQAVIFDKNHLAQNVAEILLPGWSNTVELRGIENLTFTPSDSSFNPERSPSLRFTFKGEAVMTALFDAEALKNELAGTLRRDVNAIFSNYDAIAQAKVTVMPFWRRTLPEESKKIRVERLLDGE